MRLRPRTGAPCWVHLATTDPQEAIEFYGRLFGWRPSTDARGYTRMYLNGEPVAGVGAPVIDGRPDAWRLSLLVEDLNAALRDAERRGASVLEGPFTVGDAGQGCVVLDPAGAVVEFWQAGTFSGMPVFSEPGTATWYELATRDTETAARFYSSMFGWTVSGSDWGTSPYLRCGLDGSGFAGIVQMRDYRSDVPPRWLVHFGTDDVHATAARAEKLGGHAGTGVVDLPGTGSFAGLHDPQDAAFALFSVPGDRRRAVGLRAPGNPETPDSLFGILFDHDKYRDLRAGPAAQRVRYFDGTPVWLVTRHEYVQKILSEPGISIDPRRQGRPAREAAPGLPAEFVRLMRNAVGSVDPPVHARLRRLAGKSFTLTRVGRMRPAIQQITDTLLDELEREGEADLIEDFAYPLAVGVICDLIGVPDTARDGWREAAAQLLWSPPERIGPGARRITEYTRQLIALRRDDPGEDLLSDLIRIHDADGDRLSEDELAAMVITFLNAGHETTAHLVGNGVAALLARPDQAALLRASPDLLPQAIDELIRFAGPAELGIPRYTTAPVTIGDVVIPAAEAIQVVYAAANRDPHVFSEPERLDVTRTDNPHLGLGWGIHYCLGGHLGRAQAEIAIGALLARFPDLTLAVPADDLELRRGFARGLRQLPVRLTGRRISETNGREGHDISRIAD